MKYFKYLCFVAIMAAAAGLLLACAAGTTATKSAEVPKIFIHPDAGKASAAITIWGTGFKPGEEIDIVMAVGPGEKVGLGTEKVDAIKANEYGAFTAKTAIYVQAKPGDYVVEASGSQGSEASEKLTVLPK
jgi:uncharacterized membrane protein